MISDGLNILRKRITQVDKRLKVKIVIYDDLLYFSVYRKRWFSNIDFSFFNRDKVTIINPEILGYKYSDRRFIIACIDDFREDYLKGGE